MRRFLEETFVDAEAEGEGEECADHNDKRQKSGGEDRGADEGRLFVVAELDGPRLNYTCLRPCIFHQLQIQQRGALRVSQGEELHPRRHKRDDWLHRFQVPVERDLGSRPSIIAHLQM